MDEFERGLNSAKEKFDGFSDKLSKAGKTMSNVGSTLTKGITLPIAGIGTAVLKTGMDYEAGMSKVQAISGATENEMDLLGQKAMEMAAKTKFSTADSAEAYQYMAMAGWKAGDMVDGLSGIMNLAAASGENLGTTSDIVTDALTAFGLKASDSGRFADVLAAASNNANTNVSMLGESFKYVAPVAGSLGYSVEDTSIALGLMANSGIKASQAGTALRTMLTNMAKPTADMSDAMYLLGVSLEDEEGNMYSLMDVMKQLREGFAGGRITQDEYTESVANWKKMLSEGTVELPQYAFAMEALEIALNGANEAQQAEIAAMLAGKEGMSGLLAIVNSAPEDFDKLSKAINDSSGTTEKMASIMQDNAAGAFERLKSAINVLFTQLSEHLIPIFTSVVEKATEIVNWFGGLDDGTQKLILTIAGIVAAVGPVLLGIGKVITAIGTISKAIGSITGIIKGVGGAVSGLFSLLSANPIGLVIAAIGALIAIFVALWNNCEEFREFWIGLWEGIKDVASKAWEGIKSVFENAWENTKKTWALAATFFQIVWNEISEVFSGVAEFFGNMFSTAWENTKKTWTQSAAFFQLVWKGISEAFNRTKEFFHSTFSSAWESVKNAWGSAKEFFGGIWNSVKEKGSNAANSLKSAFQNGWNGIKSAWGNATSFFGNIVSKILTSFKKLPSQLASIGGNMIKGLWNGISEKLSWLMEKVSSVVSKIKSKFTGKDGFDEHSPSKWANQVFRYVLEGGGKGLEDGTPSLLRDVDDIVSRVKDGMNGGFPASWALPDLQTDYTVPSSNRAGMQPAGGSTVINFTINGAQYSDERALVQRISQELQFLMDRRNAYGPT